MLFKKDIDIIVPRHKYTVVQGVGGALFALEGGEIVKLAKEAFIPETAKVVSLVCVVTETYKPKIILMAAQEFGQIMMTALNFLERLGDGRNTIITTIDTETFFTRSQPNDGEDAKQLPGAFEECQAMIASAQNAIRTQSVSN
jgi:hypothetical protein